MSNKVTVEQVEGILKNSEFEVFHRVFGKQCMVVAKLPNGFTIVGESACVDPANYLEDIGEQIAKERIKNKIWELEGYNLQSKLASNEEAEYETCSDEPCADSTSGTSNSNTYLLIDTLNAAKESEDFEFREKVKAKLAKVLEL